VNLLPHKSFCVNALYMLPPLASSCPPFVSVFRDWNNADVQHTYIWYRTLGKLHLLQKILKKIWGVGIDKSIYQETDFDTDMNSTNRYIVVI
jgi:hypothetical protein